MTKTNLPDDLVEIPTAGITPFKSPELSDFVGNLSAYGRIPTYQSQKEKAFQIGGQRLSPSTDLSSWETSLTDPSQHSAHKFRYLVHAISDSSDIGHLIQMQTVLEEVIRDNSLPFHEIDLLKNPEKIAEKRVISTSFIDQNHTDTWRAVGYILRVPSDNVLKTSTEDCGTNFWKGQETANKLYEERDLHGVASPDTVLEYSSSYSYNEIVLTGTGRTGKKVEITGVFIKILPDGEEVDPESASQIRRIAYQQHLPIVTIRERINEYTDHKPEAYSDTGFGVNNNGVRYMFDNERQSFTVSIYGGKKTHTMTPDERRTFVQLTREYLTTNPDETIEKLLTQVEEIPDSTLQQKVEDQRRYQQQKSGDLFSKEYRLHLIFPEETGYKFSKHLEDILPEKKYDFSKYFGDIEPIIITMGNEKEKP